MPHDSPLPRVHTLRSDEDIMQQNELMDLVTKLTDKVKTLEKTVKSNKARRKAKLVVSDDEEEDSFNQGRKIAAMDEDLYISLFTAHEEVYIAELNISTANIPVSTAGAEVNTTIPGVSTTAESLVYIRRSAVKRVDKGKAIMKEVEPVQKKTKLQLEQERLGYEEALRLKEQLDEEERQRLQAEERGRYSEADKARLLVELINKRKRLFAQQRAEQRRNKPMTQAQQRTYMCIYIKNMGSHTLQQLKKLSFDEIKKLFETTMKRAGEGSEPVEESKDKESDELSQEQLQQLMIIVLEEGMNVEALQTKYLIIDWEVYSKDTMKYWKIIRVGDHTEVYQLFEDMLKNFNRGDLVKLWDLVKERFSLTEPTDDKEKALWVKLKRLFEPDTDDFLELQRYMHDPLTWRLYDTCGVHHVSTEIGLDILMLVDKDYPLTRGLMTLMLCNKLLVEEHSEMANELLRKIFILANRPRQELNITEEKLNIAKDLRLPEEDNACMKIKTCEEIFQDYALWDVIENGNSFKPIARTTANVDGTSTSMIPGLVTTEEKAKRRMITNEVNTANVQVSNANSPVSIADTPYSTTNLNDLEEIDLKWQLALLSIRARRYFQRTSKKITINESDTGRYDKSNVECFNCHKMGHFLRERRGPKNQDNRNRNQDSSRRTVNMEEASSKAMVAIDWSFLIGALWQMRKGLTSVEEQLVCYKKNEVMFCDQIAVLKRDTSLKDSEIKALKSEIKKLKKDKESNQIKIDIFENASKSLNKLIGSQISDNSRKGV
ncbi:putative reverse transcriptase domain-containing protein, partial [Tanacetum coccineum]